MKKGDRVWFTRYGYCVRARGQRLRTVRPYETATILRVGKREHSNSFLVMIDGDCLWVHGKDLTTDEARVARALLTL